MKTLDSILGKFTEVKNELVDFISGTNEDIQTLESENDNLRTQISSNVDTLNIMGKEIKQAQRSIKQINKLTGGK